MAHIRCDEFNPSRAAVVHAATQNSLVGPDDDVDELETVFFFLDADGLGRQDVQMEFFPRSIVSGEKGGPMEVNGEVISLEPATDFPGCSPEDYGTDKRVWRYAQLKGYNPEAKSGGQLDIDYGEPLRPIL